LIKLLGTFSFDLEHLLLFFHSLDIGLQLLLLLGELFVLVMGLIEFFFELGDLF